MRRAHKIAFGCEAVIAASAFWMGFGIWRQQPRVFGHACQLMASSVAIETLAFRFDSKPEEKGHNWALKRLEEMKLTGWRLAAAACAIGLTVIASLALAKGLKIVLPLGLGAGMLCFAGAIQAGNEQLYAEKMRKAAVKKWEMTPANWQDIGDPYIQSIKVSGLHRVHPTQHLRKVRATFISQRGWSDLYQLPKLEKLRVFDVERGVNLLDPPINVETYIVGNLCEGEETHLGDRLSLTTIELTRPQGGWHLPLVGLKNIRRIVLRRCTHVTVAAVQAILDGDHLNLQQIHFYGTGTGKFKALAVEGRLEFRERKRAYGQRIRRKDAPKKLARSGYRLLRENITLLEVLEFINGNWGDTHTIELPKKLPGLKAVCPETCEFLEAKNEVPAKLHILKR